MLANQMFIVSDANDVVMDFFCGSGSTLIAAEQLNRKCYGMEISPAYCDVIVKRWENLTGKTAVLRQYDKRTKTNSTGSTRGNWSVPRTSRATKQKGNETRR